MSEQAKHTPLPWEIEYVDDGTSAYEAITAQDGRFIVARSLGDRFQFPNAELIVRSVNLLPEALETLREADAAIRDYFGGGPIRGNAPLTPQQEALRATAVKARAVLAKAEEGEVPRVSALVGGIAF